VQTTTVFKNENRQVSGRLACQYDVKLIVAIRNPVKLRATKHVERMKKAYLERRTERWNGRL
jgi:hypothetical protein